MELSIGIDVSSTDLETVMISSEDNEIVFQGKFANDITGFKTCSTRSLSFLNYSGKFNLKSFPL